MAEDLRNDFYSWLTSDSKIQASGFYEAEFEERRLVRLLWRRSCLQFRDHASVRAQSFGFEVQFVEMAFDRRMVGAAIRALLSASSTKELDDFEIYLVESPTSKFPYIKMIGEFRTSCVTGHAEAVRLANLSGQASRAVQIPVEVEIGSGAENWFGPTQNSDRSHGSGLNRGPASVFDI